MNEGNELSMFACVQGYNVGMATLDGITPLHEACVGGHFTCAKLLLEHGADVCIYLSLYLQYLPLFCLLFLHKHALMANIYMHSGQCCLF